ncbi:LEM domain-containing inner nuclear membrane protein MAN1 [Oratosquilla oratoria]|uniref:LEM domain-containing inner nuclear membrane protein MAN1 n=1 Tax=Oratosquilla oratoria TaxID=337810 RepID=UPI003F76FA5F
MASSKLFSDEDLRKKLSEHGITTPVTASTRNILIKKLNHIIANKKKNSDKKNKARRSSNRLHTLSSDESEEETITAKSSWAAHGNDNSRGRNRETNENTVHIRKTDPVRANGPLIENEFTNYQRHKPSSSLRSYHRSHRGLSQTSRENYVRSRTRNNDDVSECGYDVSSRSGVGILSRSSEYDTGSDSDVADERKHATTNTNSFLNKIQARSYANNQDCAGEGLSQNHGMLHSFHENNLNPCTPRLEEDGKDADRCVGTSDDVGATQVVLEESPCIANGQHHTSLSPEGESEESNWRQSVPVALVVLLAVYFCLLGLLYLNVTTPLLPEVRSLPQTVYKLVSKILVPIVKSLEKLFKLQTFKPEESVQPSLPAPSSVSRLWSYETVPTPENRFPVCEEGREDNGHCLSLRELSSVQRMIGKLKQLLERLLERAGLYECGQTSIRHLTLEEAQVFFTQDSNMEETDLQEGLVGLGKFGDLNRHWGLVAVRDSGGMLIGFETTAESKQLLCHVIAAFHYLLYMIMGSIFVCALISFGIFVFRYHKKKSEEEKHEVLELVEQILELLSSFAKHKGKSCVAVNHIRDSLIALRERDTKGHLWEKAVLFLDQYETRIRREVENVGGEDCQVWRWVSDIPPSPSILGPLGDRSRPLAKTWQGQAFESLETTHNLPPVSPTSCLKIRNMFDCDVEFGDDWAERVQDSLLEKCEGILILHIAVDRSSKEGCVYLKCSSPAEAGKAFRALHGWWYDSSLVTVKFLRDERYHQRFPTARYASRPLGPSNNKRLSLQTPLRPSPLERS